MKVYSASPTVTSWTTKHQRGSPEHTYFNAARKLLLDLTERPTTDDPPHLKRIRNTDRHEIWRVGHPHDQHVAVRILCWFPSDAEVVLLEVGDKAPHGDVWYDQAIRRAELVVDAWLRRHST